MKVNLPNQITIGRLVLAIMFFALIAQFSITEQPPRFWLLDVCTVIFILAAVSDIVDGYLARKYNQVTSFGRVIDPFVDKVLICGAFAFFAGAGFIKDHHHVSNVAMWMVVVIVGRELLVTGIRGFSEAKGESFGANLYGKAKMVLQSITAVWIMLTVGHPNGFFFGWSFFTVGCKVVVWATVIVTALSMLSYLNMARHILAEDVPADGDGMIRRAAITFFGLGYMPFASGTWGSLGAIIVAGALYAGMRYAGVSDRYNAVLAAMILAASVLSVVWGQWAIDYFASRARKPGDPGQFVLDEVAGQWLSVIALPIAGLSFQAWAGVYALQFVLFRVFDVLKPPPGRQLERLPAGWGILMDDLGVAVYANIIGQIVVRRWLNG